MTAADFGMMLTANGKIKRERVAAWCRADARRGDAVRAEVSATA